MNVTTDDYDRRFCGGGCKEPPAWQLNNVDDVDWIQDNSGVFVYIDWDLQTETIRLDIIRQHDTEPLQSFAGTANNVRKHAIRWLFDYTTDNHEVGFVSSEHASYIGFELARCDAQRVNYVQD